METAPPPVRDLLIGNPSQHEWIIRIARGNNVLTWTSIQPMTKVRIPTMPVSREGIMLTPFTAGCRTVGSAAQAQVPTNNGSVSVWLNFKSVV